MRAILCRTFGDLDALSIGEADEPRLQSDEILIDVRAASVSYMDCLMAQGRYQLRPQLPYVPGTDAAGIVVACGSDVTRFRPGDRVATWNWFGSYAERTTAKESKAVSLPDAVSFVEGSTILHNYLTAWYTLIDRARLTSGETVLVTGAAGGVGLACIEFARLLGARAIGAIGSSHKKAAVLECGAEDIIDYSCEDVRARIKELTGGEGIDVCVDTVGGELFATLARSMRWGGRILPIGFASGIVPTLAMNIPLLKNSSIVGVFSGAWLDRAPDEAAAAATKIAEWVADGKLNPRIDRVLPLENAREAMEAVAARTVKGRIVLEI